MQDLWHVRNSIRKGAPVSVDFLLKIKNMLTGEKNFNLEEAIREKRFSPRITCDVQATCTVPGGQEYSVVVSEIGLYGLRIHVAKELKLGDTIKLTALRGIGILSGARYSVNTISLRVLWRKKRKSHRDYMIGLQFSDIKKNLRDSWAAFLLQKFGVAVGVTVQKRKRIRIPTQLPLVCKNVKDELKRAGTVKDIGLGGMLISIDQMVFQGETLAFEIGPYKSLPLLHCDGMALHTHFVHSAGKWNAGIIFKSLNESQMKLLNSYLTVLLFEKSE
jgi:hypothetical protein